MALTQTSFLLSTCFSKKDVDNKDSKYEPIMIEMSLTRSALVPTDPKQPGGELEIKTFTTTFNLPLLTILPLNSLAVETVDIEFEMEVKSSFSEEDTKTSENERKGEGSFEAKMDWGPFSVTVKGSASYSSKDSSTHNTHYEKSNSAKYTANVHAGQLPLPKGVNTIIEAFTQAIQPITLVPPTPNNK
jgi:hypothetical protein